MRSLAGPGRPATAASRAWRSPTRDRRRGLTQAQADQAGLRTVAAQIDVAATLARPWTYERDPRRQLGLLADADRRVLVGAWAVAPQAGEWIHQASPAIRAQIPIDTLLDQVAQFPTYTEGYLTAVENLSL